MVALAVHAGVLGWWLADFVQRPDAPLLPWPEMLPPGAAVLVAAGASFVAPRGARRIAVFLIALTACALVGPGTVATIALTVLSAHVVGSAVLRFVCDGESTLAMPSGAVATLVGTTLWMALIGVTIAWPIHMAPVHVAFLAASLVASPSRTRESLAAAWRWLTLDDAPAPAERIWIGVAVAVAVMHLIVVARPEIGYDASTMHLQFAELVSHDRRWAFDVGRYAWAVMPMGADHAYLSAYLLGGERAARLLDLVFGALLTAIVYEVVRRQASRVVALASVCLLASTPLWFLESGSLFVEFAWTALLVAGLAATLDFVERRAPADFAAAAFCLAGSIQCKVIGVFWVVPLAVALVVCASRAPAWFAPSSRAIAASRRRGSTRVRLACLCAVALAIGAWPYANAWLRTGNPVFPFMNDVFRSPLFDATSRFNNPLYNAPLAWSTPYDLVLSGARYLEGFDGAAGLQWLLLYPVVAIGLIARPTRSRFLLLALAAAFGVAVYAQQSYLRYLLPAFVLIAILGGWVLGDWIRSMRAGRALLAAGIALVAGNVWLLPTSGWNNASVCLDCGFDRRDRDAYVARYAPLRLVADFLNRNLADARVGFLVFNAPAPSGFVGYSRAANWHDAQAFPALAKAATSDEVAAVVRRFRLTHAVFVVRAENTLDAPLLAFRDRWTAPLVRIGNYVVTEIRAER